MKKILIFWAGIVLVSCQAQQKSQQDENLVWSEEFNYEGAPDQSKWTYQLGNGCPDVCGWGNNELQHYTKEEENIRVENGHLVIEAKPSNDERQYTSGKIVTKNKGDWHKGYVEVRAKLPYGRGTWPAIWMLPTLKGGMNWPEDGEIDIMEHVGYNQGMIYGTIHTEAYNHVKGTQKSDSIFVEDAHENFHTYGLEWTDESLSWFVDGEKYQTINRNGDGKAGWPFTTDYHLILNLAVGGNWGGKFGVAEDIWPQKLEVDYVRVYKEKPQNENEEVASK